MSIGSCFAVNMAQKLDFKFQNSCNLWDFVSSLAIENSYFAVSEKKLQKKMYFFITSAGIVLMYIIVMLIKTIYYITGMRLLQQQSDK
jgi:hypothetical protein